MARILGACQNRDHDRNLCDSPASKSREDWGKCYEQKIVTIEWRLHHSCLAVTGSSQNYDQGQKDSETLEKTRVSEVEESMEESRLFEHAALLLRD